MYARSRERLPYATCERGAIEIEHPIATSRSAMR